MPFVYYEEPVFTIPRRNWHWISDYDFIYDRIKNLDARLSALENAHMSKEGKDDTVHTDRS